MKARTLIACVALALLEIVFLPLPFEQVALLALLTVAVPTLSLDLYEEYVQEKKRLDLEKGLPAALLQVASQPRGAAIEDVLEELAGSGGELGKQFSRITRRIRAGTSVPHALRSHQTKSFLFKRVLEMLANAYESGADASKTFKQVAEDIMDLQFISREAAAAGALQKYSLLAASALLVPFILGFLYNLVESLDFSSGSTGVQGILASSSFERRALIEAIGLGNQIYLALFALLASSFIALNENKARKAIAYAAVCLPCALLAYHAARLITIL